jgi:hypothetical protein
VREQVATGQECGMRTRRGAYWGASCASCVGMETRRWGFTLAMLFLREVAWVVLSEVAGFLILATSLRRRESGVA